jgi:hypothetical protein
MAIAVIGGLVTSTLLSLVVIPVVFTYLDDLQNFVTPWLKRLVGDGAAHPHKGATVIPLADAE